MKSHNGFLSVLLSYAITGAAATFISMGFTLFFALTPWLGDASDSVAHVLSVPSAVGSALLWMILALLLGALTSLFTGLIGLFRTRDMRTRLSVLADASAIYAAGKLFHRVEMVGHDDIARTAHQFNAMAQRLQEQVGALQRTADEELALRQQLEVSATLRERERVRRELHDTVSQDLLGLTLLVSAAVAQSENTSDQALQLLPEIETVAKRAQSAMRALLLELRPVELRERDLKSGLTMLTRELSERTALPITFATLDTRPEEERSDINPSIEHSLFLVAQEALTNALRHAAASSIQVQLSIERERVILRIIDDGIGLPQDLTHQNKVTAMGLRSMQERAQLLGGTCRIRSESEQGTEVLCIVPQVNLREV